MGTAIIWVTELFESIGLEKPIYYTKSYTSCDDSLDIEEPTMPFSEHDTLFNVLVLKFEDISENNNAKCLGRLIAERLKYIQSTKGLRINVKYASDIESPEDKKQARDLQIEYQADLLIYGFANVTGSCTDAEMCFRYSLSDTIANVLIPDSTVRTDRKMNLFKVNSFESILTGDLKVDDQSFEAWIEPYIALKDNELAKAIKLIESYFGDTLALHNEAREEIYRLSGILYTELLNDNQKAADYFSKAIERKPKMASAYYSRGIVLAEMEKYGEAFRDFSTAIRINPEYAEAYVNRGIISSLGNKFDEARKDFDAAIRINNNHELAYFNRGVTHYKQNDRAAALKDISKAISLDPYFMEAYAGRGALYCEDNNMTKAFEDIDLASMMNPHNVTVKKLMEDNGLNRFRYVDKKYKMGQTWKSNNKAGMPSYTLTILRTDSIQGYGVIIHVSLSNIDFGEADAPFEEVGYMPFAKEAIDNSQIELVGNISKLPAFEEGYVDWRVTVNKQQGGVFTISVEDLLIALKQQEFSQAQ